MITNESLGRPPKKEFARKLELNAVRLPTVVLSFSLYNRFKVSSIALISLVKLVLSIRSDYLIVFSKMLQLQKGFQRRFFRGALGLFFLIIKVEVEI